MLSLHLPNPKRSKISKNHIAEEPGTGETNALGKGKIKA
jgi:hypothetical protein